MIDRVAAFVRTTLMLGLFYGAGVLLGLALLVAAFQVGVLATITILFYRGLIVIALVGVMTFVAMAIIALRLRASLGPRDAFASAVLSLSLNLSFLVVVPVTVDRSISIFLLGEMAAHPDTAFTPDSASALFKTVYVDEYRQIDRRLREQVVSGNLTQVGDGYKISRRGLFVIEMAKATARLFDSHAGLVSPRDDMQRLSFVPSPASKPRRTVD